MNEASVRPEQAAIREKMYIHGEWMAARSGRTLPVFDPATGRTIANVPDAASGCSSTSLT